MLVRIPILLLIVSVFIFIYVRYYEKKNIYFPIKEIEFTPSDLGFKFDDVFFVNKEGLTLNGWFIKAANPRGTLLFCHGNAGNISHRLEIINILYKLNLNIFIFDYRGYGRSQGIPSEDGLYQDTYAAYQYLVSRKDVDNRSIIVYGRSIGANVAIDLVSQVEPACLISDGSFTSAYDMGRIIFPLLPIQWIITVKYDALSKIKNITTPKLIIHSRDDEVVPFRLGKKLFDAAAQPKEFYIMQGTHNEGLLSASQEYTRRLDSFINKYLPLP